MDQRIEIIQHMNGFLQVSRGLLLRWLQKMLPMVSKDWWSECVLNTLSHYQCEHVTAQNGTSLDQLDLAALLRVANRNWYAIRNVFYITSQERDIIRAMIGVRNNWAHCTESTFEKDAFDEDVETLHAMFEAFGAEREDIEKLKAFGSHVHAEAFQPYRTIFQREEASSVENISVHGMICLESDPSCIGVVMGVRKLGEMVQYDVFINGGIRTFFEGQIRPVAETAITVVDAETMRCALTAYSFRNPSSDSLYSLHAAKIDFVPYQFRPALKAITSDQPRLLIADSVGVGKTIEAGLVMKELQARNDIESILIICPKPLVAERKWEDEMKRFDEEFTPVDGLLMRQILRDATREGMWPDRYRKIIIPYSLLTDPRYVFGDGRNKKLKAHGECLLELEPPPHFDLVIVDEAHHIRHQNTNAYQAVKFFCDQADAVLFLTATPVQTGSDDLYTLLNALRPDVVLNRDVFMSMSRPNQYLNEALHNIRGAASNWQAQTQDALDHVADTQWGASVIAPNPIFSELKAELSKETLSREERMALIPKIEGLNSFASMITRTRRQDIQDFCIRHSTTVESAFTEAQQKLYDELLAFEDDALRYLHNTDNTRFMMSMLTRQAASCIFGLAPVMQAIVKRRLSEIMDEDVEEIQLETMSQNNIFRKKAELLISMAQNLPEEDPKLEAFLHVVREKQKEENNKIIVFSTFRNTLRYLFEHLCKVGVRIAQMDGSVKDEERHTLHQRFMKPKEAPDAIDLILFSEIGSEGLDYQFCDMMINYDLPWNPMRIEQRIGRIDRRGQKSEIVQIVNMITSGTVDADIYYRCLQRINIFEQSVGECAEILGDISEGIEKIALQRNLTEQERREKLEKLADNEVMQMQELQRLENNERALFGFDFDDFDRQLAAADNPWLSPKAIEKLTEKYLELVLGAGRYLWGEHDRRLLRLSADNRQRLLAEYRQLALPKNVTNRSWEAYLKGKNPNQAIAFDSNYASKGKDVMLITGIHPLVKAASRALYIDQPYIIGLISSDGSIAPGEYPFAIYAWEHVGYVSKRELIPVCKDEATRKELLYVLRGAAQIKIDPSAYKSAWGELEQLHLHMWQQAKLDQQEAATEDFRFRSQSITNVYQSRSRSCITQLADVQYNGSENFIRMKQSELANIEARYQSDMAQLRQNVERSDIHIQLLISGILKVEEDK